MLQVVRGLLARAQASPRSDAKEQAIDAWMLRREVDGKSNTLRASKVNLMGCRRVAAHAEVVYAARLIISFYTTS